MVARSSARDQVGVGVVLASELIGSVEGGERRIELAFLAKSDAQVEMGFSQVRGQTQRFATFNDGLVESAESRESLAEVAVGVGEVRLEA